MANSWFQFKQFRVEQEKCAMKVSTDACVLGAAAPVAGARRLLDIGTGTGLLALMAAQRNPAARIEAVELDPAAAVQAARNFAASPWPDRLALHPVGLQAFADTGPAPYDHLLSNPPFFRHALPSPDAARTAARHASPTSLPFATLARFAANFLKPAGLLTVLLPPPGMADFEREAAAVGLSPTARLVLHHRPGSRPLRHITTFGRHPQAVPAQTLAIRRADSEEYSEEFRALLREFYLAL